MVSTKTLLLKHYYRRQGFFFSNFSGASGISRQNPGISRQKSLISLVSKGISNFLVPTPSCGRPPPHPKKSGPKSLGLGNRSFFVPDAFLFLKQSIWAIPPVRLGLYGRRKSPPPKSRQDPGAFPGIPPKPYNSRHLRRLPEHFQNSLPLSTAQKRLQSSGASQGSLHGRASLEVQKARFAA